MIQTQTYLNVADNSGARKIMCIRILGGNRKFAGIGDVIIGVVKDATPNMPIKRSDVVRAVIMRTKSTSVEKMVCLFVSMITQLLLLTKKIILEGHEFLVQSQEN